MIALNELLQRMIFRFRSELNNLATGTVAASSGMVFTHEASTNDVFTAEFGENADLAEVKRTTLTLIALHYMLTDTEEGYAWWTQKQGGPSKLSLETYLTLQNAFWKYFAQEENFDLLEVFEALNDQGKAKVVREFVREKTGYSGANHDKVLALALRHGFQFPCLQRLTEEQREFLTELVECAFNVMQFFQMEFPPEILEGLLEMYVRQQGNEMVLEAALFESIFDLAGAAGQFVFDGSITVTEPNVQKLFWLMSAVRKAGQKALSGAATIQEAARYAYWEDFGERYWQSIVGDLMVADEDKPALMRFASMSRIWENSEFQLLKRAFDSMERGKKEFLRSEMAFAVDAPLAIEYGPDIFLNIEGKSRSEKDFQRALEFYQAFHAACRNHVNREASPGSTVVFHANAISTALKKTAAEEILTQGFSFEEAEDGFVVTSINDRS